MNKILSLLTYDIILYGLPWCSMVKNSPANAEDRGQCLDWEYSLENEIATHLIILDWEIPWTKECSPWGHIRTGHDWVPKIHPHGIIVYFPNMVFHCSNFRHSGDWVFYFHLNYIHFMINFRHKFMYLLSICSFDSLLKTLCLLQSPKGIYMFFNWNYLFSM